MSSSSSKPIAPLPFNFTSLSLGESTNGSERTIKTIQLHQLVQLFIKTHTALQWRSDVLAELNELAPKIKKFICPHFRKSTPKETAQKISEFVKIIYKQASPEQLESIRASTKKFSCDHETVKTLETLIQYKELSELCKQWLKNEKSPNGHVKRRCLAI